MYIICENHIMTAVSMYLIEADKCHGDGSEFALDLQQPNALVLVELLAPLQHPDLDGDLDDVAHSLLRLVLVFRLEIDKPA